MVSSTKSTTTVAVLGLSLTLLSDFHVGLPMVLANEATAEGDYLSNALTGTAGMTNYADATGDKTWVLPDATYLAANPIAGCDTGTDSLDNAFGQKVTTVYGHPCFNGGNPDEDQFVPMPPPGYGATVSSDTMTFDALTVNKWMQTEANSLTQAQINAIETGTITKLIVKGGRAKISADILKHFSEIRCESSDTVYVDGHPNYLSSTPDKKDPNFSGKLVIVAEDAYAFDDVTKIVADGYGARFDVTGGTFAALKRVYAKNNGVVSLYKVTSTSLEAITALDGATIDVTNGAFTGCKEVRSAGPRSLVKAASTDLSAATQVIVDGKVAEMILEGCTLTALRSALVFGVYANLEMNGHIMNNLKVVRVDGKMATMSCDECTSTSLDTIRVASHKAKAFFRYASLTGLKSIIATAKEGDVVFKNEAANDAKQISAYVPAAGTQYDADLGVETIYTEGSTIHVHGLAMATLTDVFVAGQGAVHMKGATASQLKTISAAGKDATVLASSASLGVQSITMDGKNVKVDLSSASAATLEDVTLKGYGLYDTDGVEPTYLEAETYYESNDYTCLFDGGQGSFAALKTVTVLGNTCKADFSGATGMAALTTLHASKTRAVIDLTGAAGGATLRTVWADWESDITLSTAMTYTALTTLKATQGGKITAAYVDGTNTGMPALTTVTATGRSGHITAADTDTDVQRKEKTNSAAVSDHQESEIAIDNCGDLNKLVMVVAEGHASKVSCTGCLKVGVVSIHASGPGALVDFSNAEFENDSSISNLQAVFADGGTKEVCTDDGVTITCSPTKNNALVDLNSATGLSALTTMFAQTAGKIDATGADGLAKLQFIGALDQGEIDLEGATGMDCTTDATACPTLVKTIQADGDSVVTVTNADMANTHCHVEGVAQGSAGQVLPGWNGAPGTARCTWSRANLLGADPKGLALTKSDG